MSEKGTTQEEMVKLYEASLDRNNNRVEAFGMSFSPSEFLRGLTPKAYAEGLCEFANDHLMNELQEKGILK
jgi:hypothetical protein